MDAWSTVWSTGHVPGMDTATGGGGTRRRVVGRRRLRFGALALAALHTMHLRVSASALTGGYYIYILCLIPSMALLANPMRHFEVYLGQWSLSGPGRAFRIVPMFDGIGVAVAISSIVRAIINCAMAAHAAVYLMHSLSDEVLPYTTCRDFDLKTYEPDVKPMDALFPEYDDHFLFKRSTQMYTRLRRHERNITQLTKPNQTNGQTNSFKSNDEQLQYGGSNLPNSGHPESDALSLPNGIRICKNPYAGDGYPQYCDAAEYNFFYVEVANYRPGLIFNGFNHKMAIVMAILWAIIWFCLIYERISHGRLIWNNTSPWLIVVPLVWTVVVCVSGVLGLVTTRPEILRTRLHYGNIATSVFDALETSIYIHAASMGSELIHGKGLHHYANGHIDPNLNSENVWHSSLLMLLTSLSTGGSALCAMNDLPQINRIVNQTFGSTTWILPMYSRCMTYGQYTHLKSSLLFSGLIFSYVMVSYVLLKSALHTIFEYKVKLVFIEQFVVGALILTCTLSSMIFATNGGLPLLESVDTMMACVTMPFVCALEVVVFLCVYSSHDFISDMNVSMEEDACSTRMERQWQILPWILTALLGYRIWSLTSECVLPTRFLLYALVPLGLVVVALPIKAIYNACVFFKLSKRYA